MAFGREGSVEVGASLEPPAAIMAGGKPPDTTVDGGVEQEEQEEEEEEEEEGAGSTEQGRVFEGPVSRGQNKHRTYTTPQTGVNRTNLHPR